jgi:hypothetical protein
MKKFLIAFALIVTSASFADSSLRAERRSSNFNLRGKVIATLVTTGGYCRGRCPETKINILRNGSVKATVTTFFSPVLNSDGTSGPSKEVKRYHLMTLGNKILKTLKKEIRKIKGNQELVDENPNAPMCMDLPTTTFSVVKGNLWNPRVIKIAQKKNCKNYVREGNEGYKTVKVLKNAKDLLRMID